MEAMLLRHFISTAPAELLISSIWQGLLLTAFAWGALKLAPGLRASTRFTLWLITFLAVALLPCFALGRAWFGVDAPVATNLPQSGIALHLNIVWAFVLEAVWGVASLFSLVRLFSSVLQMRTVLRNSALVSDLPQEILSALARDGKRSVSVRISEAVDAPSVIGFFRPAVVIPRSLWSELTPADLRQIVLHEMAHLERGDDWTNLLQKLLRALYPLNPALVWAERHLCREREHACDDAVLDAAGNARAYATCLTKLAEARLVRRVASLAPGFWQRHSELAGRVENILHRRRRLGPAFSRGLVAAGLAASLFGAVMLQRCPGLISFTAVSPVAIATLQPDNHYQPQDAPMAHYQQAVFHPPATNNANVIVPKAHAARQVRLYHRLQFVQLVEDQDGGGVTLTLFTVDVPETSTAHAVPTPHKYIAFQI
jgi:beta-lactamase regulating signal transducer with metallopeptidase domain